MAVEKLRENFGSHDVCPNCQRTLGVRAPRDYDAGLNAHPEESEPCISKYDQPSPALARAGPSA